jgi:hypothetical protein
VTREITSLGAVRRPCFLLVLAVLAAGCGSGKSASTTTAGPADPAQAAGGGHTIYQGTEWSVVVKGGQATALHLVDGEWRPDRSGRVKVTFLGPDRTVTPVFQVAAELSAKTPLVESALWVDGVELLEKGGGLSATRGTIYGAPTGRLRRGRHVAVAYGRTATTGTAVARVFQVR